MSYITKKELYPYVVLQGPSNNELVVLDLAGLITCIGSNIVEEGLKKTDNSSYFNTSTGEFTVPIKGLYSFSYILTCENNNPSSDDSISLGFQITSLGSTTTPATTFNPEQLSTNTGNGTEYSIRFSLNKVLNPGDIVKLYSSDDGSGAVQTYLANQSYYYIYMISAFQ